MIIEYYKYLTNPSTQTAKILGQLRETIAMEARYNRSRKQWESHLNNTKALIEHSARQISQPNEVIVLGSGLLLDIPIEFLSTHFQQVSLVDVVHLKSTKQRVKNYRNVIFLEHDITGIAEQLIFSLPRNNQELKHQPSIPNLNPKTSLVISANMLSQLHLSIVNYAEDKLAFDNAMQERLATNIIRSHLSMLESLPCKVCLITDHIREYRNESTQISEYETALLNVNLPKPNKKWYWEIAPKGELNKNISMTSEVYGYQDY